MMKSNLSNTRSHTNASGSKSRKNNKEREKRKSQSEKQENEKGSPTKDEARKYAGIGLDSVLVYSVDANYEELPDVVCYSFAEDLSYKLRYVIHDALIRARLSGRNHITSNDVSATFESINVDKVYGATATPSWIQGPEQDLYYLSDNVVNLVDIVEEDCSYIQPGDITVIRKWLPETKETSRSLKQYFETICNAVVSADVELKHAALKDISTNSCIGPVVEWFYNFCYILLSKDITYDSLTLSALDLIKSLEYSGIASLTVSEKQLTLVVRLILQRLLRSYTTPEVLKPMCFILGLLCNRIPIRDLVLAKLKQKFPEIKCKFTLPLLAITNALGIKAISEVFVPNAEFFLANIPDDCHLEYFHVLTLTFRCLCHSEQINELYKNFYEIFGHKLVPIMLYNKHTITSNKLESNWFELKSKLIKTRTYLPYCAKENKKSDIDDVFPDNQFQTLQKYKKREIRFNKKSYNNFEEYDDLMDDLASELTFGTKDLELLDDDQDLKNYNNLSQIFKDDLRCTFNKHLLIGKRNLLIPVLKQSLSERTKSDTCIDHSLIYYNL